jgi:hypothetical protein
MVAGCHIQPEQFFNLIFGYHDAYGERARERDASAGDNVLEGTHVPAGEVWIVTSLLGYAGNTVITKLSIGIYDGTTYKNVAIKPSPAINVGVQTQGFWPMKEGDRIFGYFSGCGASEDIIIEAIGYKMKLSQ